VDNERDFYTVYFSKGMGLEGEALARHLEEDGLVGASIAQVFRKGDPRAEKAARALRRALSDRGGSIREFSLGGQKDLENGLWHSILGTARDGVLVLWLEESDLKQSWERLAGDPPMRIYLSSTLLDGYVQSVPRTLRDHVLLMYPDELPGRQSRLLLRSTGWLRAKRIYAPEAKRVQASAYFALKMAGGAIKKLHGYFLRDYLLERIEHMVDNASYTSVYPRVSLAPGQRFVAKGSYIARFSPGETDSVVAVSDWLVP